MTVFFYLFMQLIKESIPFQNWFLKQNLIAKWINCFIHLDENDNAKKYPKRSKAKRYRNLTTNHNFSNFISLVSWVLRQTVGWEREIINSENQLENRDDIVVPPNAISNSQGHPIELSKSDLDKLSDNNFYARLIQTGCNITETVQIFTFLSFENYTVFSSILNIIIQMILGADYDLLKIPFEIFSKFVFFQDSFSHHRIQKAINLLANAFNEKKKTSKENKCFDNIFEKISQRTS